MPFCDLDELPGLPYSLIDMKRYLPKFQGRRTIYLETSRGCLNQCGFCYNQAYHNRKWRSMSAARVLDDIKKIVKDFTVKSFYIVDDNFFVDLSRFREIAEGLIRFNQDIIWEAQGITIDSASRMKKEDFALLEKSGCRKVHFGVESGSEAVLKSVKKNIKACDVLDVNRRLNGFNIVAQYNFMAGFPRENDADIKDTVNLIWKLMKDNKKSIISPICPYTPYPGTELYQQAIKEEGFLQKNKLEEWVCADYGSNIWRSRKKSKFLNALFFSSMFLDLHRLNDMIENPLYQLFIFLYRPIARLRVKNLFFSFMPELKLFSLFNNKKKIGR
jgi:radical SAM superfamily enzyme YgiQ (UPF0313 family)